MRSWKPPTREEVTRAIALIQHRQHRRRFFDGLENPRWVGPLDERELFNEPPAPVRNDREGTVTFPPWPESRYLARMAGHDPQTVIGIISRIPDNGNVLVYEDLADAALNAPAAQATWAVDRASVWLSSAVQFRLPAKLGALMSKLASGGHVVEAIALARILLAVLPNDASGAREG